MCVCVCVCVFGRSAVRTKFSNVGPESQRKHQVVNSYEGVLLSGRKCFAAWTLLALKISCLLTKFDYIWSVMHFTAKKVLQQDITF